MTGAVSHRGGVAHGEGVAPPRRCLGLAAIFDPDAENADAEWAAKRICYICPRLYACREWALRTDVAGVCGGLSETEREQWREQRRLQPPVSPTFVDPVVLAHEAIAGRDRHHELLEYVQGLPADLPARDVADRLGLSERTVVRYRNDQRIGVAS